MKLCTSVVWICLVGLSLSIQGSGLAEEQSTEDAPRTIELQLGPTRLRENIRKSLETGTITSIRGAILTQALWSKQKYMATTSALKIVADPNGYLVRQRLAKEILGTELYDELESHLLKVVESMTDINDVQIALRVLGKGLSSARARPILRKNLQDSIKKLEDPNEVNAPHPRIVIGLAEALCYMADDSGIDVLGAVLEWKDDLSASGTRAAAILALASLATTEAKGVLLRNSDRVLLSEDPTVAYRAFDNLKLFDEFKSCISRAACQQLARLARTKEPALDRKNRMLLGKVGLVLYDLMVDGELTQSDLDGIKESVKIIISGKDVKCREAVSLLFSKLATNEDVEIVGRLLESESAHLRTAGVKGVQNCDRDIQRRFLPDLIRLLDDPYWYTRDLALLVIRRYKGEITGSGLPKDVFLKERERIKQWWEHQQKAEGDDCD